jgi:hypothetical protein
MVWPLAVLVPPGDVEKRTKKGRKKNNINKRAYSIQCPCCALGWTTQVVSQSSFVPAVGTPVQARGAHRMEAGMHWDQLPGTDTPHTDVDRDLMREGGVFPRERSGPGRNADKMGWTFTMMQRHGPPSLGMLGTEGRDFRGAGAGALARVNVIHACLPGPAEVSGGETMRRAKLAEVARRVCTRTKMKTKARRRVDMPVSMTDESSRLYLACSFMCISEDL